jgi:hypothetical protein
MALWLIALCAAGLGCAIAECILSCDMALWPGFGLGCAMAECMESCISLGVADCAPAIANVLPSMTATAKAEMYFIEDGLMGTSARVMRR